MNGLIRTSIPLIICISTGLLTSPAFAENKCKGLNLSDCTAEAGCSWVNGYVRSDSRKVDAYCRIKSGKKKSAAMASGATKS